jgi:hypothetical protein
MTAHGRISRTVVENVWEKVGGRKKRTKIKKKPAPTIDDGDGLDNCGVKKERRGIASLRSTSET